MRISDWSSDVCSSDLGSSANLAALLPPAGEGLPDVRSRRLGSRPRGRFIRGAVRCHAADARKPSMKYSRAALLPSPWATGLLTLLLALPAFARAQDAPRPTPGTPPTVLVMGDSLSAGYGLSTEQGWVALLEDRIEADKPGWRVVNASISGETTAGGSARIVREVLRVRPAVVVIELGANDGLRGLPLREMRHNLARMIGASRYVGAKVLDRKSTRL